MLLLNMPMAIWLSYELQRQPRDSLGVYDPIDIHSRGLLKVHLRNCMIYLGYYFVMFFVAMYWLVSSTIELFIWMNIVFLFYFSLISSLIKGDPIKRHEEGEFITEF